MTGTWIARSQPREPEEPSPTELDRLAAERAALIKKVRRGMRTERQVRILRRIKAITEQLLKQEG